MQGDFRVGDRLVSPKLHRLVRDGKEIRIEPKAMQVLVYLASRPGEVASRDELLRAVWPDTFVTDDVLKRCVSDLRKALGDTRDSPLFIETIPKGGYRLVAPIEWVRDAQASHSEPSPPGQTSYRTVLAVPVSILMAAAVVAMVAYSLTRNRPLREIRSVAVLPFDSLSRGGEQQLLAEGVTDALISELSAIHALDKVIHHDSVLKYVGERRQPVVAARELDVDGIVIGSILSTSEGIRLTARLLDGRTGAELWSATEQRSTTDLLMLQAEIAHQIARGMRAALTPTERQRLTRKRRVNPAAYEAYLKAQYSDRQVRQLDSAADLLEEATRLDSNFAPAYASLAICYVDMGATGMGRLNYATAFPKAKSAALRAVALDPNLAEAHSALGHVLFAADWDWQQAAEAHRRAVDLNPHHADVRTYYGVLLSLYGRHDEALKQHRRAIQLDPASAKRNQFLAWAYFMARRYDDGLKQIKATLEIDPELVVAHDALLMEQARRGQVAAVFDACEKGRPQKWRCAEAYAMAGRLSEARRLFGALTKGGVKPFGAGTSALVFAEMYTLLGETDRALTTLERALEVRDPALIFLNGGVFDPLNTDPRFAKLHSDPRFAELRRRVGLPRIQ
jgi:DNA-binding winged helix-turn-helix (wHTH) protein/TolB-like protein/tetratricopeptide (TPR) repeat protein